MTDVLFSQQICDNHKKNLYIAKFIPFVGMYSEPTPDPAMTCYKGSRVRQDGIFSSFRSYYYKIVKWTKYTFKLQHTMHLCIAMVW